MELFSQHMRDVWKQWELRVIVILSLLLQTLLLVGRIRRSISNIWLRAMVWCTYLTAEAVAAYGLGLLSNRLANVRDRLTGQVEIDTQLIAFWAPFFLLHLGGPDVITAYSLEDNELWLRNLALLVVKTGVTVYIYFLALTGSKFSIMACVVIVIGFVKYAERILCLFLASRGHLRDSLSSPPDLGYPIIIERYQLKQQQGYRPSMSGVGREVRIPEALGNEYHRKSTYHEEEDQDIVVANEMFDIIKCLFVDLIRSSNDLESSRHWFEQLNPERAFRIVEIELLLMYELLYSKVQILASYWGAASRVASVALFTGVLLFFKLEDKTMYKGRIDIAITYLLLVVSALVDFYLAIRMISNDWVKAKRIRNPDSWTSKTMQTLNILRCPERRWSGQVSQLSLVDFALNRKCPYAFLDRPKQLKSLVENVRTHFAVKHEPFLDYMKDWIYEHVREKVETFNRESKFNEQNARNMLEQYQASKILEVASRHPLLWSTKDIDFDLSILIWHIATEICYHQDWEQMKDKTGQERNNYRMSLIISKYMLYLLVMNPAMLPVGIGQLRYTDALVEGRKYFEEHSTVLKKSKGTGRTRTCFCSSSENNDLEKCTDEDPQLRKDRECHEKLSKACQLLLGRVEGVPDNIFTAGGSKSEMLSACGLAMQINTHWKDSITQKWRTIADIWAEALIYAAMRSSGTQHAKKLSEGGELISHVWILMAHFGMSHNIRKSQGNIITRVATQSK